MVLPADRFGAQAKYIDSLVPGAAPLYHVDWYLDCTHPSTRAR